MAQVKLTEKEMEERKRIARDAEILASLDNDAPCSEYAKELKEKWIKGEITSEEELKLLLEHHKQ